jgi:hypothetical protein
MQAKPSFLPLVAGKSYRTHMGHVVELEQSSDRTLVYFKQRWQPNVYWVKNTGLLKYIEGWATTDSLFGHIIGFADDPVPSLEDMLKECLE